MRLSEPELQASVREKEKIFRRHFETLKSQYPDLISEVRGRGLILSLQLTRDPVPIVTAARERGLLIITCGVNTLRVVPPLIISEEEIEEGMTILGKAIDAVIPR